MKIKLFILILTFVYIDTNISIAQDVIYKNQIIDTNIRTVLFHVKGTELSYPVINLNSNEKLLLSFDELSPDQIKNDYQYTIIHCNRFWQPSNLIKNEYIAGFDYANINNYKQSFNTATNYVHFELTLPNDEMNILISGNYILKVYKDYNEEQPIIVRRFWVVDNKVDLDVKIKQPVLSEYFTTSHEIDFTIKHNGYEIYNPTDNLNVTIMQNFRFDNLITDIKPKFVKSKELIYDYEQGNIFPGGNEFRWFDTKSVKFSADRTDHISFIKPYFHFTLINDENRSRKPFAYRPDLNGRRFIKNDLCFESSREADYVFVHFFLEYPTQRIDGDFYIFGELTDWCFSEQNKLSYNLEKQGYELTLFLKQGYYNYQYAFLPKGSQIADCKIIEGNFYDAENDYQLFIYHFDTSFSYEKLIGYGLYNSHKKL